MARSRIWSWFGLPRNRFTDSLTARSPASALGFLLRVSLRYTEIHAFYRFQSQPTALLCLRFSPIFFERDTEIQGGLANPCFFTAYVTSPSISMIGERGMYLCISSIYKKEEEVINTGHYARFERDTNPVSLGISSISLGFARTRITHDTYRSGQSHRVSL